VKGALLRCILPHIISRELRKLGKPDVAVRPRWEYVEDVSAQLFEVIKIIHGPIIEGLCRAVPAANRDEKHVA
jgi:hypothetical protein